MILLKRLVLVCLCAFIPNLASADNGGWLDWLYGLDVKLVGVGTDFHAFCLNQENQREKCEEWFGLDPGLNFAKIKHEIDLRVAYYHNYGGRFADDPNDQGSVNAFKLMSLYHYHPDTRLAVGFGAGFMTFYGTAADRVTKFDPFWRGILTPVSVIYWPVTNGPSVARAFNLRVESSYITKGFTGGSFGNPTTKYTTNGGEWNFSVATGFDFRRRTSTMRP